MVLSEKQAIESKVTEIEHTVDLLEEELELIQSWIKQHKSEHAALCDRLHALSEE